MRKMYEIAGILQITLAFLVGVLGSVLIQDYREVLIKSAYTAGEQEIIMMLPVSALEQIQVGKGSI